ncbi:hypothetical protein MB09_11625 [Aequorivita vladivostokensis]|uniref:Uncharacterized protein n=1 Tax=Aequorivita vladivostokensis TaxID=171194 RepID=A0ABR5DGP6_9FLAO|nr:hypothetical protein MB09_11625 [Aequorivita vladivostokensis]
MATLPTGGTTGRLANMPKHWVWHLLALFYYTLLGNVFIHVLLYFAQFFFFFDIKIILKTEPEFCRIPKIFA